MRNKQHVRLTIYRHRAFARIWCLAQSARERRRAMPHYHIWPKDDAVADSYWVFAASPGEARHLVALNVSGAPNAENAFRFLCEESSEHTPAPILIYCRLTGPLTISER